MRSIGFPWDMNGHIEHATVLLPLWSSLGAQQSALSMSREAFFARIREGKNLWGLQEMSCGRWREPFRHMCNLDPSMDLMKGFAAH